MSWGSVTVRRDLRAPRHLATDPASKSHPRGATGTGSCWTRNIIRRAELAPRGPNKNGDAMYPTQAARELGILLRISRELGIVGDVTAIVDSPSELLAWANSLTDPAVVAWRSVDSGSRYLKISANHAHDPIRGQVTAVLHCDQHLEFWHELGDAEALNPGEQTPLTVTDLSTAWQAMPLTPPT